MKFLLTAINAKYIHSNPAVYSLRAYAGEALQEHIEIAEYTINNSMEEILADMYGRKPDVISFSCYIWNWKLVQELLVEVHKILPQVPIWLGGPEVSYHSRKILQEYPMVTGIMVGEGEATFRELLEYYVEAQRSDKAQAGGEKSWKKQMCSAQDGKVDLSGAEQLGEGRSCERQSRADTLEDIPGLSLPSGDTAAREMLDISALPFLYNNLEEFQNRIIYYESSRGCPYRCSYCLSSLDKKLRLRDMSVVKRELQFFLEQRVAQVKFIDRTFNCNHEHAMEIWQYLYKNDNGVTNFHFEIAADILQEDEIALLQKLRPGLVQLEIGVQSVNPQTLHAINRRMDVEKLERIVASLHKGHNIHLHLDLIAGLPYEDLRSFRDSFNRVYGMKPEQLQLGFLKVLKGSEMEARAGEFGISYLERPPYEVLFTDWLSYEDVRFLKKVEEMVEIYYNSNQYTHILPVLEAAFETPFDMFAALADYYEEKGYFKNTPARVYRYEVLLAFAVQTDGQQEARYRELLTYDMYLRENLKSRPSFAADLTPYKERIREIYQKEEQQRKLLPDYGEYDWKQLSRMTHLESLEGHFVLFDYQRRNPLTGEAAVTIVEETAR